MARNPPSTPLNTVERSVGWLGRDITSVLALRPGQVHLWMVDRDRAGDPVLLDAAERLRANRFATQLLCDRFANGQQHLRSLLARYVGRDPHELVFRRGSHGRPQLSPADFDFSWSHRDAMAMLACSRSRIGVDIERIDESKLEAVAAACHQVEIEVLERADDPATLFAQIWTAKEACLKADGRGLTIDPRTLCVVDDHGCPAELVQIPGSAPWQIQHVAVDSHHVAALASKAGDAVDVIQRHWFG